MTSLLVLASKSLRRYELLKQIGLEFDVIPSHVIEGFVQGESPQEHVIRLAETKALDVGSQCPEQWIIAADTIVCIEGSILGKPKNPGEAMDMLQSLSGKEHRVWTGFSVSHLQKGKKDQGSVRTKVKVKTLTPIEIKWYVQTGEPFDKAGGYAIQGIGSFMIESIHGSYTNVVGLPLCELIQMLIRLEPLRFRNMGCGLWVEEMPGVKENLLRVMERIERAAWKTGRNPKEIKLVAVSKTVEADQIKEAIEAGASILGENYVQEAQKKIEKIGRSVAWHFIGHLQSNKAKYAVRLFDMIHSLDSIPLAEELNRKAEQADRILKVLIEVNISGEATKFGAEEEKVFSLVRRICGLDHLSLGGLMTMPPYFDSPEMSRPYFIRLRALKEKMEKEGISMSELSMGMSNDFEIAIEEGATYVRVGTAIFGPRQ